MSAENVDANVALASVAVESVAASAAANLEVSKMPCVSTSRARCLPGAAMDLWCDLSLAYGLVFCCGFTRMLGRYRAHWAQTEHPAKICGRQFVRQKP